VASDPIVRWSARTVVLVTVATLSTLLALGGVLVVELILRISQL
jgi:hypothetical protein